jgi:hypothetical protein
MDAKITPDTIFPDCRISSLTDFNEPNSFAIVNGSNEYAIAKIGPDGQFESNPIVQGFPGENTDNFCSDDKGELVWGNSGRGLNIVDAKTKKTATPIVSYDGDEAPINAFIIDKSAPRLLVEIVHYGLGLDKATSFFKSLDFPSGAIGEQSKNFDGFLMPITTKRFLWCELLKHNKVQWQWTDVSLENREQDTLTEQLTKKQIIVWGHGRSFNFEKRIMIGYSQANDSQEIYHSIRWAPGMKDIKIEPLLLQCPLENSYLDDWYFSADYQWIKTAVLNRATNTYSIVFYNINENYPQSVSMPIIGTETDRLAKGAFVQHSTFGTIYVEKDVNHENVLLAYKLNDALEYLKKVAVKGK